MEMQPVKESLPAWMTQQCADSGKKNCETLSDADKLEMCYRGAKFPERVYLPPEIKPGTKCTKCGDVGYRFFWCDGYQFAEECECHRAAVSEEAIKKAGVREDQTFENFYTYQPWQQEMMDKAKAFSKDGYLMGQWFYIGGQVGCGKTHLCTAIVHELLKKMVGCKYMMWKDEATQLKAIINNHEEYGKRIKELTTAQVLYIDDLFKTQAGAKPSPADVGLAFQILNARYQDPKYVTIISCELAKMQLIEIDEAVGSRIAEKSRTYYLYIAKDINKNWRLRN